MLKLLRKQCSFECRRSRCFKSTQSGHQQNPIKSIYDLCSQRCDQLSTDDKNGRIKAALKIYKNTENEHKNVLLINGLLKICFNYGDANKFLIFYDDIQNLSKWNKNKLSYSLLIKCCIETEETQKCKEALLWMKEAKYSLQIHEKFMTKLIEQNKDDADFLRFIFSLISEKIIQCKSEIIVKTSLIYRFGKLTKIKDAMNVFESIKENEIDKIVILKIMEALNQNKEFAQTLNIYHKYQHILKNDANAIFYAINACANTKQYEIGRKIINKLQCASIGNSIKWKNLLIGFYGKYGDVNNAMNVYKSVNINERSKVSVCNIMSALMINEVCFEAIKVYEKCDEHLRNEIIYILAIKAYIKCKKFDKAKQIEINLMIAHKRNAEIMTKLIDLYAHFGDVDSAKNVFDGITNPSANCTASIMKMYVSMDELINALKVYDDAKEQNDFCHMIAIKICTKLNDFERGKKIYQKIIEFVKDIQLKHTLIDFYGHCFEINAAKKMFYSISENEKSIVSVNAMMNALCTNSLNKECIALFEEFNWLQPDVISYAILFEACSNERMYHFGDSVYKKLKKTKESEHILKDVVVASNLINMFGKCGMMKECAEIFHDCDNKKETVIWNAMIHAFGRNGDMKNAMNVYDEMKVNGIKANIKTFVVLLNVCSHCGEVDKAFDIWQNELNDDEMKYDKYVISALIDCFTRKGNITKATDLVVEYEEIATKRGEGSDNKFMWMSLLNASKQYGTNRNVREIIYKQIERRFGEDDIFMNSAKIATFDTRGL